ncbi:hypothetical protein PGT21_026756 [Puccinia graminis f. sp. tritici]|uniref:Uncharacterized protein n=1 Tax=Puccinia graminis f. sp. tritici TaxID=56615 RepID=A0A5B0SBE7_PUCGR|nr:hypothetical protein PGT21_026756 [Puccinia graminis f. sp. tritici]KAA1135170.1 hypothetical protein PGTUg99_005495 [Puccinia graminis f. sp. tritici]
MIMFVYPVVLAYNKVKQIRASRRPSGKRGCSGGVFYRRAILRPKREPTRVHYKQFSKIFIIKSGFPTESL